MPRQRTENFNMRLTPEEAAKLRALADERGESASTLLRQFIRRSNLAAKAPRRAKKGAER